MFSSLSKGLSFLCCGAKCPRKQGKWSEHRESCASPAAISLQKPVQAKCWPLWAPVVSGVLCNKSFKNIQSGDLCFFPSVCFFGLLVWGFFCCIIVNTMQAVASWYFSGTQQTLSYDLGRWAQICKPLRQMDKICRFGPSGQNFLASVTVCLTAVPCTWATCVCSSLPVPLSRTHCFSIRSCGFRGQAVHKLLFTPATEVQWIVAVRKREVSSSAQICVYCGCTPLAIFKLDVVFSFHTWCGPPA